MSQAPSALGSILSLSSLGSATQWAGQPLAFSRQFWSERSLSSEMLGSASILDSNPDTPTKIPVAGRPPKSDIPFPSMRPTWSWDGEISPAQYRGQIRRRRNGNDFITVLDARSSTMNSPTRSPANLLSRKVVPGESVLPSRDADKRPGPRPSFDLTPIIEDSPSSWSRLSPMHFASYFGDDLCEDATDLFHPDRSPGAGQKGDLMPLSDHEGMSGTYYAHDDDFQELEDASFVDNMPSFTLTAPTPELPSTSVFSLSLDDPFLVTGLPEIAIDNDSIFAELARRPSAGAKLGVSQRTRRPQISQGLKLGETPSLLPPVSRPIAGQGDTDALPRNRKHLTRYRMFWQRIIGLFNFSHRQKSKGRHQGPPDPPAPHGPVSADVRPPEVAKIPSDAVASSASLELRTTPGDLRMRSRFIENFG